MGLKTVQELVNTIVAGSELQVDVAGALPTGTNTIGRVTGVARSLATTKLHAPAANTAAVVTMAAGGAGVSNILAAIYWSYNAAPTGGNLKIENGAGSTVLSVDVTAAGPGFLQFDPPLRGTANTALVVTLAAGGEAATGKVNLNTWTE